MGKVRLRCAGFPVVASGGISTLADVRALAAAGPDVVEGCIIGRALYEGNFTLAEALEAAGQGAAQAGARSSGPSAAASGEGAGDAH